MIAETGRSASASQSSTDWSTSNEGSGADCGGSVGTGTAEGGIGIARATKRTPSKRFEYWTSSGTGSDSNSSACGGGSDAAIAADSHSSASGNCRPFECSSKLRADVLQRQRARRHEMQAQEERQQAREDILEAEGPIVQHMVDTWAAGKGIRSLLLTVGDIFPAAVAAGTNTKVAELACGTSADVRRAYKRVARLIHPDKLAKGDTIEAMRQQLFGQKLFPLFTAEMEKMERLMEADS